MTDQVFFQGYKALALHGITRGICTFVSKTFTFVEHDLRVQPSKTETSLVEVIPSNSNKSHIFPSKSHSSPSDHRQRFETIVTKATKPTGNSPFVVAGDFNTPFHAWNYQNDTVKGRSLWLEAADAGLSILTDPAFPTRRDTSSTGDSVPNLVFSKNTGSAVWSNLLVDLGSDHYIAATSLQVEQKRKRAFSVPD